MRGALEQIGDRNLDFKINYSGVREIDECLVALDDMRYALKTSLQKQWETEQEKSRQMSALAHDIKTPLTVVRGNSELLLETELTDEQKNLISQYPYMTLFSDMLVCIYDKELQMERWVINDGFDINAIMKSMDTPEYQDLLKELNTQITEYLKKCD